MYRRETSGRSNHRGFRDAGVRNSLLVIGLLATIGLAAPVRALAEDAAKQPLLSAVKDNLGKREKLTRGEARDLMQALRQVQASVAAERTRKAAADVDVKRPERTVTPPTLTSAELDRLVARYLSKNDPKVAPAPITTDVEFVRRIYFDLIGKPPTPSQYEAFLKDHRHDKRARLIDRLLASPDWGRNWARYWRDVVRFHATNDNLRQIRFDMLEEWLAGQLAANRPWDEIARAMITATGRNDKNGAVAFPLAYDARPVEMAGEVSRIFMGVQIQCAQCHDHKTDSWKREQFHEFASFFAGARRRRAEKPKKGKLPVFAVVTQNRARYTMPDKDDPKKQTPIAPRFFLTAGNSTSPALPMTLAPERRRELVASYITGQDNPWFARAFVNRTWYALMGEAFYEPIDDMGPERSPRAPEVLEPLADQWQKGGYDIRWLYRTIMNTDAYQRRARSTNSAAGKTAFASACPSRLRADQLFEALAESLGLPLDEDGNLDLASLRRGNAKGSAAKGKGKSAKRNNKAAQAAGLPKPAGKKSRARLRGPRLAFEQLFGVDPSIPNDEVLGTIPQALFLMNGGMINARISARPGTILGQILAEHTENRAALNALYLRVLSRPPTPAEARVCGKYLASVRNRNEAFEDIYWSLINSTEFITRR